jgi:pyruvate/2-oxoglutarate dehydrogenase complex dihydrolipoamide dehydrogenase (E3) component
VEAVLVAVGRRPNVQGMDLEVAGVAYNENLGVQVNHLLRTTNEDIYAVGDCCSQYQFTHNSDIHARYVVRNALFYAENDRSKVHLPWCTYTEPEIAHVGKYPRELESEGTKFDTYFKFMDKLDRALCEGKYGIMKIHTVAGTDEILGATLVGGSAGDMISQITTAMFNGIGLAKMGGCVYPYPTYAESFRHLADQYNRKKLAPAERSLVPGLKEIRY